MNETYIESLRREIRVAKELAMLSYTEDYAEYHEQRALALRKELERLEQELPDE